MSASIYHLRLIAYRIAAWLIGGTVHQFEGRDRAGRWHRGLCILSHGALVAHKVAFRKDANVYVDTAGSPAVTGSPFWVRHTTESADDHTCARCCQSVSVDFETEWLGPDDNYHFNLCNDCAQQLVVELWGKLQANDKHSEPAEKSQPKP